MKIDQYFILTNLDAIEDHKLIAKINMQAVQVGLFSFNMCRLLHSSETHKIM